MLLLLMLMPSPSCYILMRIDVDAAASLPPAIIFDAAAIFAALFAFAADFFSDFLCLPLRHAIDADLFADGFSFSMPR